MNNEKMCRRKKVYWSYSEAASVASRCTQKRGTPLRVYHCPYCYEYHLTSQV